MVTRLGYTLSSEEFDAPTLVAQAQRAEQAGFAFASISDHFHPWIDEQGESPFVWGTLGAISQRTERIGLMTGVTCPTTRIHPVLVAQAAATVASLLPGLALKQWPNGAIGGSYFLELPLPAHFEEAAEMLDTKDIGESIVCGPDRASPSRDSGVRRRRLRPCLRSPGRAPTRRASSTSTSARCSPASTERRPDPAVALGDPFYGAKPG